MQLPRTLEAEPAVLSEAEQALSAALMRVNHVGEICAQALYTSQALAARLGPGTLQERERLARHLEAAGQEETDHLAWCKQRLDELGSSWGVGIKKLGEYAEAAAGALSGVADAFTSADDELAKALEERAAGASASTSGGAHGGARGSVTAQ